MFLFLGLVSLKYTNVTYITAEEWTIWPLKGGTLLNGSKLCPFKEDFFSEGNWAENKIEAKKLSPL